MSDVVVTIGFLLLVPSLAGMAAAFVLWAMTVAAAVRADVPAATAGVVLGATFTFGLAGIGAFVAGLLGWLLVMKKTVLQCDECDATTPAS